MDMSMMGFGVLMMFIGFLVVVAVVAIAVWAVMYFIGSGRASGSKDGQARQILDQRYARGEIGDEEYKRIRRELG
jgi:putative membrane protein